MKALVAGLAVGSSLLLSSSASALTNVYSTRFERSEGYDPAFELIGQNKWVTDSSSYGGNGLLTNFLGTQAAYIGLWPLDPPDTHLSIWQPLNFSPLQAGLPIVKFSVLMAIIDSTNGYRDDFFWTVYNSDGYSLFTIDFFNDDLRIYYALGTNSFVRTGSTFSNDVPYTLTVTMDFAHTNWGATLNGAPLVTNKPMTTTGAAMTLGDIDAVWFLSSTNQGDNFMIFDNYQVTAEAPFGAGAQLTALGRAPDGRFSLRLTGSSGARYAIEATTNWVKWTALSTNTAANGSFDFIDTNAPALPARFYRSRFLP